MKPDLGTWITTEEVSRRMGVKPRTVVDMVTKGRLHPKKYQRPGVGGGAINLFDPAEVEELLQQRVAAKTEIMPATSAAIAPVRVADLVKYSVPSTLTAARVPLWLNYDQAVEYTGLGKSRLRELVKADQVKADRGPHGAAVLKREDLDKL